MTEHLAFLARACLALALALGAAALPAAAEGARPGEALCLSQPWQAAPGSALPETEERLAGIIAEARSALAPSGSILRSLQDTAPRICTGPPVIGAHGYFDPDGNRIWLSTALPRPMAVAVLLHELRHMDQFQSGACPSPQMSMETTARVSLAMEADAAAMAMLLTWRLAEAGDPAPFAAISNWAHHGDIAEAFAAAKAAGASDAAATSAAFAQWYVSDWRRESYYIAACSDYLDTQDRTHALPGTAALAEDFFTGLCRLETGAPYVCDAPVSPR